MNVRKQPTTAWHSLGVSKVAEQLGTSEGGLSEDAATTRLAEFGPNKLPQKPPTPLWAIVLRQFRSPLIYILLLAAVVSLAIGDVKDAGFILGVLLVKGDPPKAIPAFASENGVDLIVMGTVARSGLTGMLIGKTAERILDDLKCSVLAVKPDSFVSLIKAGEYIDVSRKRSNED